MKITIIGGGPAGYEAALHASHLGAEVVLIEAGDIGGTCLNRGCIPTKTLLEHSHLYHKLTHEHPYGVVTPDVQLDYSIVQSHKESVTSTLRSGIESELKKAKVELIRGYGKILDNHNVQVVDGPIVQSDKIIIATGSRNFVPEWPGTSLSNVLDSTSILDLNEVPKSLTIVGGGVIGIEFATVFAEFGSEVTVLEYAKNIVPRVDTTISKRLKSQLTRELGIQVMNNVEVTGFEAADGQVNTHYEYKGDDHSLINEKVLIAIGRTGNFDLENMDQVGIEHNGRFIKVDESYATTVSNIYAIGDVNGLSLLAHSAYDQARQLTEALVLGNPVQIKSIPDCIFSSPEIASIGLTEDSAKEKGIAYRSNKTLYGSNGKALAMNAATGMIKSLMDDEGRLLGLHIMGAHASDLIHYGTLMIEGNLNIEVVQNMIFAHPTLGELFSDHLRSY